MPLDVGVLSNKNILERQPRHPLSRTYSTRKFSLPLKPLTPDQQRRAGALTPGCRARRRGRSQGPCGLRLTRRPAAFRETKARRDLRAPPPQTRAPRPPACGPASLLPFRLLPAQHLPTRRPSRKKQTRHRTDASASGCPPSGHCSAQDRRAAGPPLPLRQAGEQSLRWQVAHLHTHDACPGTAAASPLGRAAALALPGAR